MLPRREAIIADASCLIVLANIGRLNLLEEVFGRLLTTPEVAKEFGEKLPEWIQETSVKNLSRLQLLRLQIDLGEASAIALAMETPGSVIILDDLKARKIASRLGLQKTGTLGVVIKARLNGHMRASNPLLRKCGMPASGFLKKSRKRLSNSPAKSMNGVIFGRKHTNSVDHRKGKMAFTTCSVAPERSCT